MEAGISEPHAGGPATAQPASGTVASASSRAGRRARRHSATLGDKAEPRAPTRAREGREAGSARS